MGSFLLLSILTACPLVVLSHWPLLLASFPSPLSSDPPPNARMSQSSILVLFHVPSRSMDLVIPTCWWFSRYHLFPEFQIYKSYSLSGTFTGPSSTHLKFCMPKTELISLSPNLLLSICISTFATTFTYLLYQKTVPDSFFSYFLYPTCQQFPIFSTSN